MTVVKAKSKTQEVGFSLVDVLVIVAALALIAVLMLPAIAKRHTRSSKLSCANHLKMIGLAYRQWAIDNGNKYPAMVSTSDGGAKEWIEAGMVYTSFLVMSNELNSPKTLFCPQESDPRRVVATTFASFVPTNALGSAVPYTGNRNVSYFVGMDADEARPNTILSGDDNFFVAGARPESGILTLWTNSPIAWTKDRHVNHGYVGFGDGSVLGLTTPMLRKAFVNSAVTTNRLALP